MDHPHPAQSHRPGGQQRKSRVLAVPTDARGGVEKDHRQPPLVSLGVTRHLARHPDGLPVIFQAIRSSLEALKDPLRESKHTHF